MTLSQDNDTPMGVTSLITTLGNYFARYGALSCLCNGGFPECRLELELADRRRDISHHGVSAVHVHDAHVHETGELQAASRGGCFAR